ncbi:WYL domain-containing protein [Paenibacillus alkalitolerans]|uniref:WYL domain-containing protein n=1 Tax=Paenibacillus alkalitolerans TaxID=2799335 RepID=UPI0018F5E76D|nr:WYL domain-containing protein [Paenibacillus alkalitolerans]
MLSSLMRCAETGESVEIIYMDVRQRLTQRIVKPISFANGKMKAYCYVRRSFRVFAIDRILSVRVLRKRASGM